MRTFQYLELKSERELWMVEEPFCRKIHVVVGKNGVREDKVEGDLATPMGKFKVGPVFGHSVRPQIELKIDYIPIFEDTVAVDDPQSKYYNQIVRRGEIAKPCWKSCEEMWKIKEYELGAVIQYNWGKAIPGKGSAIFLHIWEGENKATAGCIAMSKKDLIEVLTWLDHKKEPHLIYSPF